MFQSFEDISTPALIAPRLAALRKELIRTGVDGFIVPHADEYQNEFLAPYAERLAWVTGFTGSAGLAIILKDRAALFVDGRYTLQAPQQTDITLFDVWPIADKTSDDWLKENLAKGAKLSYDPWLHGEQEIKRFTKTCSTQKAFLIPSETNLLDAVWHDQPARPTEAVWAHALKYAGQDSRGKREEIAHIIDKAGADAVLLTKPESLCWLFNIRGRDIARTPLMLAYAILYKNRKADLFIDPQKTSDEINAHLGSDVTLKTPEALADALADLAKKTVQIDPASTPVWFVDQLQEADANVMRQPDPCAKPKACKNNAELEGMRAAHIRDGAALTRFLCWFDGQAPKGTLDEITAVKKLEEFRTATNQLHDLSFETISGSGPHGAIVHYRVTESTNRTMRKGELFLLDSGAQYEDGTTDVTRTLAVSTPSQEMRTRFTQVLKGHIALSSARFPEGSTGSMLDSFARSALWQAGVDYDHGTGHGVGAFLGVHEGPQNISRRSTEVKIEAGMIISNEPGYYKSDAYGIRIENLVEVIAAQDIEGGDRPMMSLKPLTLAPMDLALVDKSLLLPQEITWLNNYHARVREELTPLLDATTSSWLAHATRAI